MPAKPGISRVLPALVFFLLTATGFSVGQGTPQAADKSAQSSSEWPPPNDLELLRVQREGYLIECDTRTGSNSNAGF
jgi:hypothetical protein